MAQARKGPKAGEPLKSPTKTGNGSSRDPIVATVRELAAVVADHGLSELIVETSGATITLRRGGIPVAMPMPMPMSMPMPMPMSASGFHARVLFPSAAGAG